jgi:tetratricopeptide (TPR) repeat protein
MAAKDQVGAHEKDAFASAQATAAGGQGWRTSRLAALIAAMVLVSLIQNFVAGGPGATLSVFELLRKCLFESRSVNDFAPPVWLAVFCTWLGVSWLLTVPLTERSGHRPRWPQFGLVAVTSGGIGLLFAVLRAWQMSKIGPLLSPSAAPASVVREAMRYELAFPLYFWSICALLLVGGFLLSQSDLSRSGLGPTSKMLVTVPCSCLVVVSASFIGGMRSVQADVSCHFAEFLQIRGNLPAAIELYRRAVQLKPHSFFYREQLGYALGTLANFAPDRESFERCNQERESVLEAEKGLFVSRSARMLGLAYLEWAGGERLQEQIHELALRGSRALHRAALFDPRNSVVWMESAIVDSLFLGHKEEAAKEKTKALELAERQGRGNLGGYYLERSTFEPRGAQVRSMQALAAILYFQEAMRDPKAGEREAFVFKILIAEAYLLAKDMTKAVEIWQESLTNAPPEELWRSEEFQARLELSQTNKSQALRHVESAITKAPPSAIEELTMLKNFIRVAGSQ